MSLFADSHGKPREFAPQQTTETGAPAPRRERARPDPETRRRPDPSTDAKPASDADGPRTRTRRGHRATDFTNWQPPVEDGDDEPLLPGRGGSAGDSPAKPVAAAESRGRQGAPGVAGASDAAAGSAQAALAGDDGVPYVELFVGAGRRDGVRAQDLLKALVETAGLEKDHVRRIRVRDRHSFVAVRKDDATRAIDAVKGTTIGQKSGVAIELARERGTDAVEAPLDS